MSAVPALPYAGQPSGATAWLPALSEFIVEAFSRIQIRGPLIGIPEVLDARRSMNFILQEWSNRGVNLWKVADEGYPDICLPMQTGVATYNIPRDTVNLLDSYIRVYTPGATLQNIGIPLIPLVTQVTSEPLVTQVFGDPMVEQPGSDTMSCTVGSQYVTLKWRAHGLIPGSPIFWGCPVSIGGIAVSGFSVVTEVVDWDHVVFMLPVPARVTQVRQGATPLFWTSPQSPLVGCILPGHGFSPGDLFPVGISTAVGGLTLYGNYSVSFVLNSYIFFINPTGAPIVFLLTDLGQPLLSDNGIPLIADGTGTSTADAQFENGGQPMVATQAPGLGWTDIFLWPISRNDYAFLPDKQAEGRPTTYWFNRAIYPTITVWPVPPGQQPGVTAQNQQQFLLSDSGMQLFSDSGIPLTTGNIVPGVTPPASIFGPGPFFAFIGYRMREIEDANPMSGQGLDAPRRFFPVFAAELCAALAEKYKPEMHQAKLVLAAMLWDKAAMEDREKVEWAIIPDFSGFFV